MRATLLAGGALAAVSVVGLIVVACGPEARVGPDRSTSDGPLSAAAGSGGNSMYEPGHSPWAGTFGGFILCTRTGEPLTLDGVEYDYAVEPVVAARSAVRVGEAGESPVAGRLGGVGKVDEGHHHPVLGVLEPVAGFEVKRRCNKEWREAGEGFDEFMTMMRSNGRGAWVTQTMVRYHDRDGRDYELTIPWQMLLCGTDVELRDAAQDEPEGWCEQPPRGRQHRGRPDRHLDRGSLVPDDARSRRPSH